jgi:NADPH:quinone reductase-like Zn-dependent oxidoreductase
VGRRPDGKRIYFVAADDADAAKVAAAMNPAMSSWVALRRRVPIQPGQSVVVLGATGVVQLTGDREATDSALATAAAESDIVLDYLWGQPAQQAIVALLTARSDRGRALDWIQIGAVAGPAIELPSVALRSANFRLQGSGQGAVSAQAYLAELPSLVDEINQGTIAVTANTTPLAQVEQIWTRPDVPGQRTVLVP